MKLKKVLHNLQLRRKTKKIQYVLLSFDFYSNFVRNIMIVSNHELYCVLSKKS